MRVEENRSVSTKKIDRVMFSAFERTVFLFYLYIFLHRIFQRLERQREGRDTTWPTA